jgi:hypothetical protein
MSPVLVAADRQCIHRRSPHHGTGCYLRHHPKKPQSTRSQKPLLFYLKDEQTGFIKYDRQVYQHQTYAFEFIEIKICNEENRRQPISAELLAFF